MFERTIKLIGIENFTKIKSQTIAIIGLGGVGGYATEALIRSGVHHIILVDYDSIDITNLNRQIIATTTNLAKLKTDEFEKRILAINPNCNIIKLSIKLDISNLDILFQHKIDYLIDCCDTISVKQELIKQCLQRKIIFISSMATGNKLDASQLQITDIYKTSYDPIAKKIRKYLKEHHIKGKIPVVYSKEQNPKFQGSIPSMIFTPATSGLLCANYIITQIIKDH